MRAAVFTRAGKPLTLCEVADPAPRRDEIVLAVRSCGICGTDLHLTALTPAALPHRCVLGHEFAGEVVALGKDVGDLRIGDRIAALPIFSCGTCVPCRTGSPVACKTASLAGLGKVPGGFAQFARAQARHCFVLPDALSFEDGALAEPLAVALHGVNMAAMRPGSKVAVLGAGPIGLAAIWWTRRLGAGRIAALAPSDRRKNLALAMGADSFIRLDANSSGELEEALGGPPDVVFECVGVPGMIERSITLAPFDGTVVVLGFCVEPETFNPAVAAAKQITLRFSLVYSPGDYLATIAALCGSPMAPRSMITDRIALDALPRAFEDLRSRSAQCKVLVDPSA